MTDREKVIKGLEEVIAEAVYPDRPRKFMMSLELAEDALALLKAQEPRVLTLDEVVAVAPGTVVWLEDYDKTDVIAGLVKRVFIYTKVIDFLIVAEKTNDESTADLDNYGERWRCWTSRPDEKRRAETPWE